MRRWDPKSPDTWAQLLGLVAVPMFGIENLPPRPRGNHYLMLDGSEGSFVLSTSAPKALTRGINPIRWAWSANVRHSVVIDATGQFATVRRWDAPQDIEERPVTNEKDARTLFKSFEESNRPPSGQSVIDRGLETFRAIRAAIERRGGSALDVILAFNTLLAWVALHSDTNGDIDIEFADAVREVRHTGQVSFSLQQVSPQLHHFPIGDLARLLRKGDSGSASYLLDAALLIRHASGPLYQEAHRQLLAPASSLTPSDLFPDELFPVGRDLPRTAAASFIHHTPPSLARALLEVALDSLEAEAGDKPLDILDPACGSGVFLIEAFRETWMRHGLSERVALRGFDESDLAIAMADFCLRNVVAESRGYTISLQQQNSLDAADWGAPHIIAMNPPFKAWEDLNAHEREFVERTLGDLHKGRPDLAFAFVVRALNSLKPGGVMAALVPPSFLEGQSAELIRAYILERTDFHVRLIGHFNDFNYFDAAVEPTFIVISRSPRETPIRIVTAKSGSADRAIRALRLGRPVTRARYEIYDVSADVLSPSRWTPLPQHKLRFIESLTINTPHTVSDFFDTYLGIRVGNKGTFIVSERELSRICPRPEEQRFFRPIADRIEAGRIQPSGYIFYPYDTGGELLLRTEQELKGAVPRFYNERLQPAEKLLKERSRYLEWWELTRPVKTWLAAKTPRIISQSFGRAGNFAFDREGQYAVVQGVGWVWKHGEPSEDLMLAYLGLLNSEFFNEVLSCFCPNVRGGQYSLYPQYIKRVPLPSLVNSDLRAPLSNIGRAIFDGRAYNSDAQKELILRAYGLMSNSRTEPGLRNQAGESEDNTASPSPLDARIAELAALREGWFGPGSVPLDPSGLENFKAFLNQALASGGIPAPYIYPTPEGGAQAEWSFPSWEVSATAFFESGVLQLHATHLESDLGREVEIPLASAGAVDSFLAFMSEFTNA